MKLSHNDLLVLSHCATTTAYQAGHAIANYTKLNLEINNKSEGLSNEEQYLKVGSSLASQVVTEVDLISQKIILECLAPTLETYDLGLLSEESVDDASRFEKDYFWCIDPLDGTLPFIEETPGYAVSIALISKKGIPQIGVIFDPTTNNLYSAVIGNGLKKNGQKWHPLSHPNDTTQPLRLITDRSFFNYKHAKSIVDGLSSISKQLGYNGFTVQALGGAVMNACWALEKGTSCYFKFPKKRAGGGCLWDYAATTALYTEAGAIACNMSGDALDLNRADSTFMNHKGALFATNKELAGLILKSYKSWISE